MEEKKLKLFKRNLRNEIIFSSGKIKNIKQLKNGKILCYAEDLILFSINSNIINSEIIKTTNFLENEDILDIIELKTGIILGITNFSIIEIKLKDKENKNNEIFQLFKIPEDWFSLDNGGRHDEKIKVYELENNKLLIHCYAYYKIRRCLLDTPYEINFNKLFIVNLDNFEIVHNFEQNKIQTNIVILQKYICIKYDDGLHIYSINNYELLKTLEIDKEFIRYNENIILSNRQKKNEIIAYNISDLNKIKYKKLSIDFPFRYSAKKLYKLSNEKIILYDEYGYFFIIEFLKIINFFQITLI